MFKCSINKLNLQTANVKLNKQRQGLTVFCGDHKTITRFAEAVMMPSLRYSRSEKK